jgi:hypothetical protein
VGQIIRNTTARKFLKISLKSENSLLVANCGARRGSIGTIRNVTNSDIIKNYFQVQGKQEEKQAYVQMKIITFK